MKTKVNREVEIWEHSVWMIVLIMIWLCLQVYTGIRYTPTPLSGPCVKVMWLLVSSEELFLFRKGRMTCRFLLQNNRDRLLGGGFKHLLFSTRTLGKWSNLTSIVFSNELKPPFSHFQGGHRWRMVASRVRQVDLLTDRHDRTTGNPGDWGGNSWVTNWSRIEKGKKIERWRWSKTNLVFFGCCLFVGCSIYFADFP